WAADTPASAYSPAASVATTVVPSVTVTPAIPASPASRRPSPFASAKTAPDTETPAARREASRISVRPSPHDERRGRRHLARADRGPAGRAQVLVELAVRQHEQEPLPHRARGAAAVAEQHGSLQRFEVPGGPASRRPGRPRRHDSR